MAAHTDEIRTGTADPLLGGPILWGWIMQLDLTVTERVVFAWIVDKAAFFAAEGGVFRYSIAGMALGLNIPERTIQDALKGIEDGGHIGAERRPGKPTVRWPITTHAKSACPPREIRQGTHAKSAHKTTNGDNQGVRSSRPLPTTEADRIGRLRDACRKAHEAAPEAIPKGLPHRRELGDLLDREVVGGMVLSEVVDELVRVARIKSDRWCHGKPVRWDWILESFGDQTLGAKEMPGKARMGDVGYGTNPDGSAYHPQGGGP